VDEKVGTKQEMMLMAIIMKQTKQKKPKKKKCDKCSKRNAVVNVTTTKKGVLVSKVSFCEKCLVADTDSIYKTHLVEIVKKLSLAKHTDKELYNLSVEDLRDIIKFKESLRYEIQRKEKNIK
jgi:hypothetical protein